MIIRHIILAILWVVYCALHSVLASPRTKNELQRRMKNYKWYRLYYTLFAFVSLIALFYYQLRVPAVKLFVPGRIILVAGVVVSIAGVSLMIVCIRKYFMSISGLRSLFFASYSNELQVAGVHKYVRHPLYLGTFVFIWSLLLLLPYLSLLIANAVITVYTLIGIELEERKLMAEFGEDYVEYCQQVPKLIPFLKPKR